MRWPGRVAGALVLIGSAAAYAQITPPLIDAAKAADVRAVEDLLRREPASVNATAVDGTTALYWAAERDETSIVRALLKAGADARLKSRYGVSPLALAAANGNGEMMRLLLGAGADPHAGLSEGETALMTAARTGKIEPLKLLLANGADVNARTPGGQTALMWAAARNNADAVRLLVEAGADLAIRTHNPSPAPRMSVFYSAPPTGFTALLFAVRAGSLEAVKALLDFGADVNDELSGGESALLVATANAHWELAGVLLDRGANPNAARAGWSALHQAVRSRRPNLFYSPGPIATGTIDSLDFIKKLIAKGVDVNARMMKNGMKDGQRNRINRLGATAFFLAAKGTDLELMKVLAAAGADPKMPSADGTTPLMVAAGLGIWYVGEDAGSLPGQEDEVLEAVKLCVRLGNGVNDANLAGETPMHGAAFRGVNAVVEFLVDQGARLDPRDVRGWTPFTIANGITHGDVFKQQPHTAALLEKLMAARGLSTIGQTADGTECLDCIQTRADQAQATLERDRRMEAEFAKAEAARLAQRGAAASPR
jgi:ankyrin repeat protein